MCEDKNSDNMKGFNKVWVTEHCDFITFKITSDKEKSNNLSIHLRAMCYLL